MLLEKANIKVLPGRYLSRETAQGNPGEGHVRGLGCRYCTM